MLDEVTMENVRDIIQAQDTELRNLLVQHQQENPGHVVTLYGDFIQCNHCSYHVHASGLHVVQHTAIHVVWVGELVLQGS